ncbi:MAG: hypothetical protein DHS20C01_08150 [marine bacterium B5-7]|nr:MAG: hypothetical protein DHS20C01_08150 [marine bacterium B5-7]
MKVLFDICHPAHVHFFRNPIKILEKAGHDILVTSRQKEMTTDLLDSYDIPHIEISRMGNGGPTSLLRELCIRDKNLYQIACEFKPSVMAAIGGTFISHVGFVRRIPSVVFYDTEQATLQNLITYPFATRVVVPECYDGWIPKNRSNRYPGYHELSYLHPDRFTPDRQIALDNGLSSDSPTYLLRTVSMKANHDIGIAGLDVELVRKIVVRLSGMGRVLLSSEYPLPDDLAKYAYSGDPQQIHHLLAFADGYVGESATMASECAVLGTPAVYISKSGRSYTEDQELKYGLVKNLIGCDRQTIADMIMSLQFPAKDTLHAAHARLLKETIDVSTYVCSTIDELSIRSVSTA